MILEDKFLKKIEEIKENISKINDPLEMVRFLDEIQINTAKWCNIYLYAYLYKSTSHESMDMSGNW